jgi:trehalose 6-phosphate synthase/phosphatase
MKFFIVSNRLPIAFTEERGEFKITKSSGGLVSGISSYLESINTSDLDKSSYNWIGWPGISFPQDKMEKIEELLSEKKLLPVFQNENIMDKFYYGFCNKTIWPLFHYFPAYTIFNDEMWEIYKKVNENFCDIICKNAKKDDIIWIHDYHLMLLPAMLREKMNNAKIGFFMHIPFPHFEIFRFLPPKWR